MSDPTHPCPAAPPAASHPALSADEPAALPLRVAVDPATGRLCLERDEAVRVVLALKHLASYVHWSPAARGYDEAIAAEAEWMAETLGDHALAATSGP